MSDFDKFMAEYREQALRVLDPDCSTVQEEIDAMDWHFSEIARLITDLENQSEPHARKVMAEDARRTLQTLIQRSFRAKMIAMGQRVTKSR